LKAIAATIDPLTPPRFDRLSRRDALRARDVHCAHVLLRLRTEQSWGRWERLMRMKEAKLEARRCKMAKMRRVHLRMYFGAMLEVRGAPLPG
jgi:hypothetical protein